MLKNYEAANRTCLAQATAVKRTIKEVPVGFIVPTLHYISHHTPLRHTGRRRVDRPLLVKHETTAGNIGVLSVCVCVYMFLLDCRYVSIIK